MVVHPLESGVLGKTGEYDHTVQFDLPNQTWVGERVLDLARGRPPQEKLFATTYQDLIKYFKIAASRVGAGPLHCSPYGLRHGGASHDKAANMRGLLDIQRRGNWKSWASVRRYEKSGRIALQLAKLPHAVRARLLREQPSAAAVFASACVKLLRPANFLTAELL